MLEVVILGSVGVAGSVSSYPQHGTKGMLVGIIVLLSALDGDSTNSFTTVLIFEVQKVDH